jgi:SNF2 family DNA or RNA helicase
MIICDEATKIKTYSSKVSSCMARMESKYIVLLTGTPLENSLSEAYNMFRITNPETVGCFNHFRELYYETDFYGNTVNYRNHKIFREATSRFMIRHKIADVGIELPPLVRQNRIIELSKEHRKIYDDAYESQLRELNEKIEKVNMASVLAKISYLCEVADSPELIGVNCKSDKIAELLNILEEIDKNSKIIIFTRFEQMAKLLSKYINSIQINNIVVSGSTDKEKLILEFKTNKDIKILISTDCTSYGSNFQFANYIFNYDFPWNPAVVEQRIKRLHRIGQTKTVIVTNLIAKNTIEEQICNTLYEKMKASDLFIDGKVELAVNTLNLKNLISMLKKE